jgi:putative membrane protein
MQYVDSQRYTLHFSNERTFLAWVRTAAALMGFGYVIARFALYLDQRADGAVDGTVRGATTYIGGIAMTIAGLIALVMSTRRYHAHSRGIDCGVAPRTHDGYVYACAVLVGVAGLLLMVMLLRGGHR